MKVLLFWAILICSTSVSFGQSVSFGYELDTSNGVYTPLENPSYLTSGVWDDPTFEISLGFEFEFDSKTYQKMGMNDQFNGGTLYFDNEGDTTTDLDHIVAYYSDIIDPGYNEGQSQGYIAAETVGEAGSRICKIEWNNVAFYNEVTYAGTADITLNFQLWLYEGSNDIEWHFGTETINNSEVHELYAPLIGLLYDYDNNTDDFTALFSIAGDMSNPEIDMITDLNAGYPPTLNEDPSDGMIYRLSSMTISGTSVTEVKSQIEVNPTVVTNEIFVQVQFENQEELNIQILDVLGRNWSPVTELTTDQRVDLSALPAGQYFVNIRSNNGVWTQKIIKE